MSRRESSASSKDSGSDVAIEEEDTSAAARKSPSLQPPDFERSPRIFGRALRKTSFTISTPILEEKGTKFDEAEEDETIEVEEQKTESSKEESTSQEPIKEASVAESKPAAVVESKPPDETTEVHVGDIQRKSSEPREFSRFKHIDAGDLVSSEGNSKVVSALEFQSAALKASQKKYQSLSAEDIPTWVAQEKPQPVISAKGDVTFEYKSRLPSIKAFIRREANELATYLKGQQTPEPQEEIPAIKSCKYPLFSIRPPTLDIADHQLHPRHFLGEQTIDEITDGT